MRRSTLLIGLLTVVVAFTSYGQPQAGTTFLDTNNENLAESYSFEAMSHYQLAAEKDAFDAQTIAKRSIKNYKKHKQEEPHMAVAHYREKAISDGKYIMFMESLGYSIFLGHRRNAAPLSNYKFFCENTVSYVSNSKWSRYANDNLPSLETVPNGGSTNLNLLRVFEESGLLSSKSKKYSFEAFASYEVDHDKILVIEYAKGIEKGFLHIKEKTNQIQTIEATTSSYWSTAHHKRVRTNSKIDFKYFDDAPFVSTITTWYNINGLQYINSFEVLEQKFDSFQLDRAAYWSLNNYSLNPFVFDDPAIWEMYDVAKDDEMDTILAEIGVSQDHQSPGYWFYGDRDRSDLARTVIATLKVDLFD